MEIYEVEESDPSMWPFSERVYVLTSASGDDIVGWLGSLEPSEVERGYAGGQPSAATRPTHGLLCVGGVVGLSPRARPCRRLRPVKRTNSRNVRGCVGPSNEELQQTKDGLGALRS